jgi:hypothetical protein
MLPGEGVATARAACRQADCTVSGALRCAYVDGGGRRCPTWWCPGHAIMAAGRLHCRRHAGIAGLLAGEVFPPPAPDVGSRAAALVAWMQRQLDAEARGLLQRIADERGGGMVVEPLQLVVRPRRGRRWRAAWKLADHLGLLTSLSVEVDESRDDEVLAAVDARLVGHGVPPWIERRRVGTVLAPEHEESERRAFSAAIARSLELVATHRETASDSG